MHTEGRRQKAEGRRQIMLCVLSTAFCFLLSSPARAQKPIPFPDVIREIDHGLPNETATAQCGGWDFGDGVNGVFDGEKNPRGKISQVKDLPGRTPVLNMMSAAATRIGMAGRGSDLIFPDSTEGFVTACSNGELRERGIDPDQKLCSSPDDCRHFCENLNKKKACRESPNCSPCKGQQCRSSRSFFRRYKEGRFERDSVKRVPGDRKSGGIDAACFGFFTDPNFKGRVPETKDFRCVIFDPGFNLATMRQSQSAKGELWPMLQMSPPFVERGMPFDPRADLWYQNLSGAFSLLSKEAIRNFYDDLSFVLLDIDWTKMRTMTPPGPEYSVPPAYVLHAPDDTADPASGSRTLSTWWQLFSTQANVFFSPPVVLLLFPEAWSLDLTPLAALTVTPLEPSENPYAQSIAATLGARSDLFERVGELIEHSALLKLKEERIGVEVPRTSGKKLSDALIEWERYAADRRLRGQSVPPGVDDLISKMRAYIERVDRVEMLRSELPEYLRRLLEKQRNARRDITEWVRRNASAYKDFLNRRNERLSIASDWRELQRKMRDFHDRVNLPWCRIDLYTMPVYSFIGSWMPGRPGLGGGERASCDDRDGLPSEAGRGLPHICTSKDDRSLIIDFTDVSLSSRSFTVPSLDVNAVDITLPQAPDSTIVADLSRVTLPDLKPLPSIFPEAASLLPEQIRVEKLPEFTDIVKDISKVNVAAAREAITQARRIVEGMTQSYALFWESFTAATPELRCDQWGSAPCGHTEDLIERVVRFSAQPMVFLPEHLAASGPKPPADLGDDLARCPVEDRVCERLTKALELPRMGIRAVFGPEAEDIAARVITSLRRKFRSRTLNADAGLNDLPPTGLPAVRFYPVFWVPRSAELRVPPSP